MAGKRIFGRQGRSLLLALAAAAGAALLLVDILTQRGVSDVAGGFEEIAFVRNEQNKGGIVRIYAFTVSDTAAADYLACGNLLPHNDYGSTTVAYFFEKGKPAPDRLKLDSPHVDADRYRAIARYAKDERGVATVTRFLKNK